MATHHTLISGTAHKITGGSVLIAGTKYQIGGGYGRGSRDEAQYKIFRAGGDYNKNSRDSADKLCRCNLQRYNIRGCSNN